jgi:hypothetical protein
MKNLLKQFVASDDSTLDGVEPSDLSSVEIKSYFDNDSVVLKIFKISKDRKTNNKPYTFNKRLSMKQANMVIDKLRDMRKVSDDFFDDGIAEAMEG